MHRRTEMKPFHHPSHYKFQLIFLFFTSISSVTARDVRDSSLLTKVTVRAFDGFQYLEPVLLPAGSYIALETLPSSNSNLANLQGIAPNFNLPQLISEIVKAETDNFEPGGLAKAVLLLGGTARTRSVDLYDGVRVLDTTRLPAGIFIPDRYIKDGTSSGGSVNKTHASLSVGIQAELDVSFMVGGHHFWSYKDSIRMYITTRLPHLSSKFKVCSYWAVTQWNAKLSRIKSAVYHTVHRWLIKKK